MSGAGRLLIVALALAALVAWQAGRIDLPRPISANQPNSSLEFSLHVGSCSSAPDQTVNCIVPNDQPFVVTVSLDSIPGPYDSLGFTLAYEGITSKTDQHIVWPDCAGETIVPADGFTLGASCSVSGSPSTFTGTVLMTTFNCEFDSQVSIVHSPTDTYLFDHAGKTSTDNGPDVITIECLTPTDTPVPSDTPTPTTTPVPSVTPTPTSAPATVVPGSSPTATSSATPAASATATGTPGSVGGAAFDVRPGTNGSASTQGLAVALAALTALSTLLGLAAWRRRR